MTIGLQLLIFCIFDIDKKGVCKRQSRRRVNIIMHDTIQNSNSIIKDSKLTQRMAIVAFETKITTTIRKHENDDGEWGWCVSECVYGKCSFRLGSFNECATSGIFIVFIYVSLLFGLCICCFFRSKHLNVMPLNLSFQKTCSHNRFKNETKQMI